MAGSGPSFAGSGKNRSPYGHNDTLGRAGDVLNRSDVPSGRHVDRLNRRSHRVGRIFLDRPAIAVGVRGDRQDEVMRGLQVLVSLRHHALGHRRGIRHQRRARFRSVAHLVCRR